MFSSCVVVCRFSPSLRLIRKREIFVEEFEWLNKEELIFKCFVQFLLDIISNTTSGKYSTK